MSPYRAPALRSAAIRPIDQLDEDDPSGTRKLCAWSFSDGTTRISVRVRSDGKTLAILLIGSLFLVVLALGPLLGSEEGVWLFALLFGVPAAACCWRLLWCFFGGEQFSINRSAVVWKRAFVPWRRAKVFHLDDVSTVVVSGSEDTERLDLQLGRKRLELCRATGHHGDALRWIARRLRRAIDHARASS